jgi:hypothetical protein
MDGICDVSGYKVDAHRAGRLSVAEGDTKASVQSLEEKYEWCIGNSETGRETNRQTLLYSPSIYTTIVASLGIFIASSAVRMERCVNNAGKIE